LAKTIAASRRAAATSMLTARMSSDSSSITPSCLQTPIKIEQVSDTDSRS
jgi:hypothetical protein